MRWLLIVLAFGALAAAGYFETQGRSSYSAYSEEQLTLLEEQLARQVQRKGQNTESLFTAQLLREERERRNHVRFALFGAGGFGVLAGALYVARGVSTWKQRGRERHAQRAGARANSRLDGEPRDARQKAAALLGVAPNAPRIVIDAALEAHLRERDLSRLDGLAPDLQKMMLEQREALVRARDLLVG
ncbi:hypothetical protein P2318_33080 [Myxococcaceae bacterium GXIMD 01537]